MTTALAGMAEAGMATSLEVSMGGRVMGMEVSIGGRVMGMDSLLLTWQQEEEHQEGKGHEEREPQRRHGSYTVMGCFMFLTTSSVKGIDDWIGFVIISFTSLFQALLVL